MAVVCGFGSCENISIFRASIDLSGAARDIFDDDDCRVEDTQLQAYFTYLPEQERIEMSIEDVTGPLCEGVLEYTTRQVGHQQSSSVTGALQETKYRVSADGFCDEHPVSVDFDVVSAVGKALTTVSIRECDKPRTTKNMRTVRSQDERLSMFKIKNIVFKTSDDEQVLISKEAAIDISSDQIDDACSG